MNILLGLDLTNPDSRFLATSASKTTTARIEVELSNEPTYTAVVEFLDRNVVKTLLLECVERARDLISENKSPDRVAEAFMEHPEQRFRLKYILGNFTPVENIRDEVTDDEEEQDRVGTIGNPEVDALIMALYQDGTDEEIAERAFELISLKLAESPVGSAAWPHLVSFSANNQKSFGNLIKVFTDNHYTRFGKLLTPLIKSIKMKGPFNPPGYGGGENPDWIFIDGEGLGHVTSTVAVPDTITSLLKEVDIILIIDNAAQPLQHGTQALLRAIAPRGLLSKTRIVFTHFDQVRGSNLDTVTARRNHVISSLHNFLRGSKEYLCEEHVKELREFVVEHAVFFSYVDDPKRSKNGINNQGLQALYTRFEHSPLIQPGVHDSVIKSFLQDKGIRDTIYNKAIPQFFENEYVNMHRSIWNQVKALCTRFVKGTDIEYRHLRPIANLQQRIAEMNFPLLLNLHGGDVELANLAAAKMDTQVRDVLTERLSRHYTQEWRYSENLKGKGSHTVRVDSVDDIYKDAFTNIAL